MDIYIHIHANKRTPSHSLEQQKMEDKIDLQNWEYKRVPRPDELQAPVITTPQPTTQQQQQQRQQ